MNFDPLLVKALQLIKGRDDGTVTRQLEDLLEELIVKYNKIENKKETNVTTDVEKIKRDLIDLGSGSLSKKTKTKNKEIDNTDLSDIFGDVKDLDVNDDDLNISIANVCVVCRKSKNEFGDQLIECQDCHDSYHQNCHTPPITENVNDPRFVWYCFNCSSPTPTKTNNFNNVNYINPGNNNFNNNNSNNLNKSAITNQGKMHLNTKTTNLVPLTLKHSKNVSSNNHKLQVNPITKAIPSGNFKGTTGVTNIDATNLNKKRIIDIDFMGNINSNNVNIKPRYFAVSCGVPTVSNQPPSLLVSNVKTTKTLSFTSITNNTNAFSAMKPVNINNTNNNNNQSFNPNSNIIKRKVSDPSTTIGNNSGSNNISVINRSNTAMNASQNNPMRKMSSSSNSNALQNAQAPPTMKDFEKRLQALKKKRMF